MTQRLTYKEMLSNLNDNASKIKDNKKLLKYCGVIIKVNYLMTRYVEDCSFIYPHYKYAYERLDCSDQECYLSHMLNTPDYIFDKISYLSGYKVVFLDDEIRKIHDPQAFYEPSHVNEAYFDSEYFAYKKVFEKYHKGTDTPLNHIRFVKN